VGLATEEVESWRHEGASPSGMNGSILELAHPLPPPLQDVTHLNVYLSLMPPPQAVVPNESCEPEILEKRWQEQDARWKAIEGLEATVDTLRIRLEGLRLQLDGSLKKTLKMEEKLHALSSDMARWNKAKSRVHYGLPKVREFIHRATWVMGTPERKQLEAFFKTDTPTPIPFAQMSKVSEQLENLLKDRQVLLSQGVSVCQECETIFAEVEGALKTLQSNAAANARKKENAARAGGKFFKDVRRLSGAD
jgi:hypothetical protein